MKLTCHDTVKDLSQGLGLIRHWYCPTCHAHIWRDKHYTSSEWDIYREDCNIKRSK
jgi:hypothetical protein